MRQVSSSASACACATSSRRVLEHKWLHHFTDNGQREMKKEFGQIKGTTIHRVRFEVLAFLQLDMLSCNISEISLHFYMYSSNVSENSIDFLLVFLS
jgi:hypothetical protein